MKSSSQLHQLAWALLGLILLATSASAMTTSHQQSYPHGISTYCSLTSSSLSSFSSTTKKQTRDIDDLSQQLGQLTLKKQSAKRLPVSHDEEKTTQQEEKINCTPQNKHHRKSYQLQLDLSDNPYLQLSDIRLNSSLTSFRARNSNIWIIPVHFFDYCANLEVIDLGYNQLYELNPELLKYCVNLRAILLDHNKLETLGLDMFAQCKELKFINLDGNPLTHDETFMNILILWADEHKVLIKTNKEKLIDGKQKTAYDCSSQFLDDGRHWTELDPTPEELEYRAKLLNEDEKNCVVS